MGSDTQAAVAADLALLASVLAGRGMNWPRR